MPATVSLARILFGTDEPVAERVRLKAGPLALDLRGAKILHIRCGEHEVWHGVAFLFRDADWGTPEPVVDHVDSTIGDSSFRVEIRGRFPTVPEIDFTLRIDGADGRIAFEGIAVPRGDIEASRIGLCVMHPMTASGASIEVEHIDGRISRSTFPELIPPWPPFMLIRAIGHEYAPGRRARCTFEGDAFELEDQRNNSDASFKTYSRSNLMPRPYWLRGGVAIRQLVELRLETSYVHRRDRGDADSIVRVSVGDAAGAMPDVGIEIVASDASAAGADGDPTTCAGSDPSARHGRDSAAGQRSEPVARQRSDSVARQASDPAAGQASGLAAALAALRPAHLHLAIDAGSDLIDWRGVARLLAVSNAALRLDVNVDYAHTEPLDAIGHALDDAGIVPSRVAVFPSEQRCLDAARRAFPRSAIGGGTPHFFVQLNRIERLGRADFLTFTTSPTVHGADDDTVMLTLQSLPSMIETLRAQYPEARFAIGPSIIGARRSPLGKQPETDGTRRVALARSDPRCRGLFGAAWVLGYVAQMARAGVDAATLMSLTGPSGVVQDPGGERVTPTPAYRVIQRLAGAARLREVNVSDPTRVAALALDRARGFELLLANLTGEAIDIELSGCDPKLSCAIIDAEACAADASADFRSGERRVDISKGLRLGAYAVASIA